MKTICFITTGNIKNIATAKRALGLANPLTELEWKVYIIMEDCEENRHRVALECNDKVTVKYFPCCSMIQERNYKNHIIKEINPDFLYICAFVTRNIVGISHHCKKLVEHSELQSGIPDMRGFRKLFCYMYEFYSIVYADAMLNASAYLQKIYKTRARTLLKGSMPMLYYPYAFNPDVIKVLDIDFCSPKFTRFANKINFVFLGSVTRNYGVFTILDAVKELKSKYDNFQMLILGYGRHYDEAVRFVEENDLQDYVFIPGYITEEEISEYFSLASAFVSPMNNTVQDWARCPSKMYLYLPYKKPVITCQIGEPYEILKDEGCYYLVGNSLDFASKMEKVITRELTSISIDPQVHSWSSRAIDLNNWIIKL